MMDFPSALPVALAGGITIGTSGIPGVLWRRSATAGQPTAMLLQLLGSCLGLLSVGLFAREREVQHLVLGSLPLGQASFALDGLSAFFLIPIFAVSALGSVYGVSYWSDREHPDDARGLRFWWGSITAAMVGVVLARDAVLFLFAWEAMALSAFFLIGTEQERPEVTRASWVYLVATHAGTLCLLGHFALLAKAAGSTALWPNLAGEASAWLPAAAFGLGVVGFGLKAGLMPLHVWLPGAHANAPSHVSALLSGVMLKTGIYGILRVCGLLPGPPLWWGGVLLAAGAVSGLLGIAMAVAQHDLKRLLAYSSIENIGIVSIGIGLATVGRALDRTELMVLGLSGALLHVLNHSLFKPLLFLSAGNVLHATGTRRISALGGLAQPMPRTFLLFAVGAVSICGLPPLNGFVSELVLYLGLLRAALDQSEPIGAWVSLAVPVLAMIGALAVAAFVKALGIIFGGSPRSPLASRAHDPGPTMLGPMLVLALACLAIGLLPSAWVPLLERAIEASAPLTSVGLGPSVSAVPVGPALSTLVPFGAISGVGLALLGLVALLAAAIRRRFSSPRTVPTWDCGYVQPTPRMQYGASSFSDTLAGLFGWALRSQRSPPRLATPFPAPSVFRSRIRDALLEDLVQPALSAADRALGRIRILQRGPVQMYMLYVFVTILLLIVVTR